MHRVRSQKRGVFFPFVVSFAVGRLRYLLHEGSDTTRDDGGERLDQKKVRCLLVLHEHPSSLLMMDFECRVQTAMDDDWLDGWD